MSCTSSDLQATMRQYSGGSEQRYRHSLNPGLLFSEGMKAAAECADAFWLIDWIALRAAPVYAKAWLEGSTGIGIVTLKVFPAGTPGPQALLTLSLEDGVPPAISENVTSTDFPEGNWNFYLGTDELGENKYVTTLIVPAEY